MTLARAGKRVLLVSTDPASNVGQVFGLDDRQPRHRIPDVPGLAALEIDPEQAADAYRERIIGPVRGLLPEKEIAGITESLSGSCTTEIASFDEFTHLLTDDTPTAVRPRHLRHRTHGPHHPAAAAARVVDRLPLHRQATPPVSARSPVSTSTARLTPTPSTPSPTRPDPADPGRPPSVLRADGDRAHLPRTHRDRHDRRIRRDQRCSSAKRRGRDRCAAAARAGSRGHGGHARQRSPLCRATSWSSRRQHGRHSGAGDPVYPGQFRSRVPLPPRSRRKSGMPHCRPLWWTKSSATVTGW